MRPGGAARCPILQLRWRFNDVRLGIARNRPRFPIRGLGSEVLSAHSIPAGKCHFSRRTILLQKAKDSFIDHRRLGKGQIVTSAGNDFSRHLGSHSLEAAHSLFGRVNDFIFTGQEQCGGPQTSPFGIGQDPSQSIADPFAPYPQRSTEKTLAGPCA
jgi:hypothetical protein